MKKGMVSVIIPTYNRKDFLVNAIDSIMQQSYQLFEIIIVDDNSNDGTCDFVNSLSNNKIKYKRNDKNLFAAASRNEGIKISEGEFIAFLDDDDVWYPSKLEKQVKLFDDLSVGLVYSSINLYFNDYKLSYNTNPSKKGMIYKDLLQKNYVGGTVSVILRRQALDSLGGEFFVPSFPAREEYDLWIRISKNWKVDFVIDPLVRAYYRNTIDRISTDVDNYVKGIELINERHKEASDQLLSEAEKKNKLSFQQFFLGSQAVKNGKVRSARKYYLRSYRINKNKKALLSYLLSFVGIRAILISRLFFDKIKTRKHAKRI